MDSFFLFPRILIPVMSAFYGIAALPLAHWLHPYVTLSKRRVLIALAPSLLMLALFCSFGVQLHNHFSGWPPTRGIEGFSPSLLAHACLAEYYFGAWIFVSLLLWPIVFVTFSIVRRCRSWLIYLSLHSFAFVISFIAIHLAPNQYLDWWWD